MFLNDLTGKAPVRSVYMVPVVSCGISKGSKTKHILGPTCFVGREQQIDLGLGKNNVSMLVLC